MQKKTFAGKVFDKIIFFSLCCVLGIDMITGYFYNMGTHLPVSQIFKLFLMIILIIRIILLKRSPLLLFYLAITLNIIVFFSVTSFNELAETIILFSKFLMTVLIYIYFRNLFHKNPNAIQKISQIIKINLVIVFFNVVVLGIIGVGFSSYHDEAEFSNRGFFYAGNELAVLIIIIFSYILFESYRNNWKYKLILNFILLTIAFCTGSKTAILGTIFLFLFIPKIAIHKKRQSIIKKIIFVFIIPIIIFFGYKYIELSGILSRWSYFYDKGGIVLFLFSGRIDYVLNEISEYLVAPFPFKIMGLGGGSERTVEMEFFDVLLNYGVLGIFVIYSFYLMCLENARRLRKNKNYPYAGLSFFTLTLVLCISFFAGHTIFSGMAGIFTGIITALAFYKIKEEKKQI